MSEAISWGEPIEMTGARPEWLDHDENFLYRTKNHENWYGPVIGMSGWQTIGSIRLRADHPYYRFGPIINMYQAAVQEIRDLTQRRQLPLTIQINDIARKTLGDPALD